MLAQRLRRSLKVAAAAVLQVQADEVDQAVFCFFQLGAQKLAAKVARNLHHALGRIGADGGQLVSVNDAVLQAVGQCFLKEGALVKQRDAAGVGLGCVFHGDRCCLK